MRTATNNSTANSNKNFKNVTDFQDIQLGTIYTSSWGYDMTIVQFFEVVKRSGNTIYTRELNAKIVDGSYAGHKMPVLGSYRSDKLYRNAIKDNKWAKIDGHLAHVWDGEKQFFNTLD